MYIMYVCYVCAFYKNEWFCFQEMDSCSHSFEFKNKSRKYLGFFFIEAIYRSQKKLFPQTINLGIYFKNNNN